MLLPFKKTLLLTMGLLALLLIGLLPLSIRQYQLHRHHQEILRQTEQLLFQFGVIREHIIESLVNNKPARLQPLSSEVEVFHANISRIMENRAIPDKYKLAFVNQLDLPGLVLLLRNVQSDRFLPEEADRLNSETRTLGERLALFNRMVMEDAKRQVVDFQTAVIGILALVVLSLIALLLGGYRRLAVPLFAMTRQLREVREGRRTALANGRKWHEVEALAVLTDELLAEIEERDGRDLRHQQLLRMAGQLLRSLPAAGDAEALYAAVSRSLLANPEYCLVWLGIPEPGKGDLLPVAADGSSVMTGKECKECMAVLLSVTEEEDEPDQALEAYRSGKPVIRRNILAGVPKGLLRNTPLAEGQVSCAALPLSKEGEVLGVLNIYSLESDSFEEMELQLLSHLGGLVAVTLACFNESGELKKSQAAWRTLLDGIRRPVLLVSRTGTVLEGNAAAAELAAGGGRQLAGSPLSSVVSLPPQLALVLSDSMAKASKVSLVIRLGQPQVERELQILPVNEADPEAPFLLLIGDVPRGLSEAEAGSMALEINNMSNGIINYAQLLTDELDGLEKGEQATLFGKIIKEGERIAALVQPLLYGEREKGFRRGAAEPWSGEERG